MARLQHPHIVRLHAFYEDGEAYYIVTELMTGGELFDRIVSRSHYSEREARDVVRTVAEAVAYMHAKGIVHRCVAWRACERAAKIVASPRSLPVCAMRGRDTPDKSTHTTLYPLLPTACHPHCNAAT